MIAAVTGRARLTSRETAEAIAGLGSRIRPVRFVTLLEQLAVAAVAGALDDAGMAFPVGSSDAGIYLGIDDAIEEVKDEYFKGIVRDGMWGASPMLFPYTTPNAFAAQISIAFDLRGESITMPITHSAGDVIEYATRCVMQGYITRAVAGGITVCNPGLSAEEGRYAAEFFVIEPADSAAGRRTAGASGDDQQ